MIGNFQAIIPPPPPQQLWKNKYPSVISGILSSIQFILTVIIIGCEVGSMLIDMVTATIYVGLWASLFFMIAWISQAGSACCCRNRGCATYTLTIQCISMFFAACVIGFDAYYLVYPTTCFFSSSVCNSSTRGLFYSTTNFNNIKIPLIIGQLATGGVMFVSCLLYIIIYIITSIRVRRAKHPSSIYPQAQNQVPSISNGILTAAPMTNYPLQPMANNGKSRITEIVCPTCSAVMHMTTNKNLLM